MRKIILDGSSLLTSFLKDFKLFIFIFDSQHKFKPMYNILFCPKTVLHFGRYIYLRSACIRYCTPDQIWKLNSCSFQISEKVYLFALHFYYECVVFVCTCVYVNIIKF
jgi:hypothetical protein